ncbi:cysteine hydrolase [Hypericibacter adhaerens]|uniref:Cysteine hydrolase n=1 Tax=Hypericibacter adhaerens TaxID=2602016 RepID=A0A5J6N513_9PROT|nr:isochorismatase family cysteine hydrolase [Hypericibacter adhaerens]QEX24524.1 cysteine hydrolase [Hypericibacter adhaerens]
MTAIKARPFDYPYDGRLDPARTALLVIDLQVDFLSEEGYFARQGYDASALRAIIPAVRALIAAARQAGCPVIYTRQGYRSDLADRTAYEQWRHKRANLPVGEPGPCGRLLVRGEPGFQIIPELEPAPQDIIVDKTANGAFYATDLDHVLRARGITHLLFTGCTTDVCVHTTLREANDRNYQCLLVEDGCASGDAYAHEAAVYMTTIEGGLFGVVAKTQDVIAGFASLR